MMGEGQLQSQRSDERIRRVIREGDYASLVSFAEELGKTLVEQRLTTSQIRTVFGRVKQLQMRFDANRLRMLKPKLAYMAARAGQGGRTLQQVLSAAVDEVFAGNDHGERFRRMADFFEGILAYHKAYGGRD